MSMAALIALAVLGHTSAGSAIGPDDDDRTTHEAFIQFPAEWSLMIDDARERFSSTGQRLQCFDIYMRATSDFVFITFGAHPDAPMTEGGGSPSVRAASSCGEWITFEYTSSGEFVRYYYSR